MRALLGSEQVIQLALSIAREDANPMDLMGVIEKKGTGHRKTYVSLEGNRRTCAYMLLLDPERIPVGVANRLATIKKLEKAAANASFTRKRNAILFKSRKQAEPWINIMHVNDNDGRGRRRWSADQRARASGGGRNKKALAILDLAEHLNLSKRSDREKKLTTVQRYIGNPILRQLFALDFDRSNVVLTTRSAGDAVALFSRFMEDVQNNKLSSRKDSEGVAQYAAKLIAELGLGEDRYEARSLMEIMIAGRQSSSPDDESPEEDDGSEDEDERGDDGNKSTAPSKPPKRTKIGLDRDLELLFHQISSSKLLSLYQSCGNLALSSHTPVTTVGIWSILETMAGLHKGVEVGFIEYFNNDRITNAGFPKNAGRKEVRAAIERIALNGNSTKHSLRAANFNGDQLANDIDVLVPFMKKICEEILDQKDPPK
nr:hypothetical protein [uncultured Roseibium sp.]